MVKIGDYNPYEINQAFFVEEGDYSIMESVQGIAGNDTVGVFSAPIHKYDYVTLADDEDKLVKIAEEGDKIIGQVIDNPQFYGDRPNETAVSGEYNRRIATVQLWGDHVKAFKLVEDNQAVAVGDSIVFVGDNAFDKADSTTDSIALTSAKANTGAKITVLLGYRGL